MIFLAILKWLKRNFGHVYVRNSLAPEYLWRFRCRYGRISLVYHTEAGIEIVSARLLRDGRIEAPGHAVTNLSWQYFLKMGFPLENVFPGGYWK